MRNEGDASACGRVELDDRNAEERSHRRPQSFRAGRIRTACRKRDAGAERIRRADERADVPRVRDTPQREGHRPGPPRQILPAVDTDHARGMRERRHLGEQLGRNVFPGDQQVDRIGDGGLDQILAFRDEQPKLVSPAPVVELADELEPLVVAGRDQASTLSAALACSAIAPNAAGSLTARSARILRSSSMPALPQPWMNWLYDSPFCRAAALMRVIQSWRKVRFLTFRSR